MAAIEDVSDDDSENDGQPRRRKSTIRERSPSYTPSDGQPTQRRKSTQRKKSIDQWSK